MNDGDYNKVKISAKSGEDQLKLTITRHNSCQTKDSNPAAKIEWGDHTVSEFVQDMREPGCFVIKTMARVNEQMSGTTQVYTEIRQSLEQDVPNVCIDYDKKTGCGGHGSCIYCKNCTRLEENELKISDFRVEIDGRSMQCRDEPLERGLYDNIQMKFCLPSKDEFLESQGYNPDTFDKILKATKESDIDFYMRVYSFEYNVAEIMQTSRVIDDLKRQALHYNEDEALPYKDYLQSQWVQFMAKKEWVACHQFIGKIGLKSKDE